MSNDKSIHTSSIWWLLCLCVTLTVIALGRLADLMLVQGASYRARSDENRLFTVSIPALRGVILDRSKVALTQNIPHFYLATSSAARLFGNEWSLPEIDPDTAAQYLVASSSSILIRTSRGEISSPAIAHVVGYTGYVSAGVADTNVQVRVGRTGIEKSFETLLAGMSGKETLEISAKGVPQRSLGMESEPIAGKQVQLSLDYELTQTAFDALAGKLGAVVATDMDTNQILIMTSSPSYTIASLGAALKDPNKPLLNRAVTAYPPGSTFKLMTALTALKAGTITKDTTVDDEGEIKLGERIFGNWYWRQYGRKEGVISLERAIARSNDIYFYKTAESVGPDKIDAVASEFGFGKPTGIQLPGESVGLLPNSAWKEKKIGEKWYTGDTYNMGIGQGYVLATPVQVNNMTATVGRRGTWCPLTLLLEENHACTDTDLNKADFETVIAGMVQACSTGGTAFPFFPINEKLPEGGKVACKTGTAEFGGEDSQGRKKTHGWFTMFYPETKPKIAITVFLESTAQNPFLEGSKDGAPIAVKVFEKWVQKYGNEL